MISGRIFQYQNQMIMTAGYLVGELSHSTWEEFTRKRIFEPLGMTSSSFSIEDMKTAADHSLPYGEKKDQVVEIPYRNIDAIGPAGSINSNVVDMANWVILNLNKGKFAGQQVVSEAAMTQIQSPQMVIQDPALLRSHRLSRSCTTRATGWVGSSRRTAGTPCSSMAAISTGSRRWCRSCPATTWGWSS